MSFEFPRALSERPPEPAGVRDWIAREFLPSYLSLRKLFSAMTRAFNDGAIDVGGVTIRVVTGVPAAADADGSVAFRVDGGAGTTLYHREGGAWIGRA